MSAEEDASSVSVVKQKDKYKQNERKVMNNKFDELAKGMAQSVTRRQALKKFGVGLAGMALACFGLANRVQAHRTCRQSGSHCQKNEECCSGLCSSFFSGEPTCF